MPLEESSGRNRGQRWILQGASERWSPYAAGQSHLTTVLPAGRFCTRGRGATESTESSTSAHRLRVKGASCAGSRRLDDLRASASPRATILLRRIPVFGWDRPA